MPKITSTITRRQQEAENVPALPKPIDEMTPDEISAHYGGIRDNRIHASEKRKAVRAVNKSKKQEAAMDASKSTTEQHIKKLVSRDVNFSFDTPDDTAPASEGSGSSEPAASTEAAEDTDNSGPEQA